jgi:hypothetical protein
MRHEDCRIGQLVRIQTRHGGVAIGRITSLEKGETFFGGYDIRVQPLAADEETKVAHGGALEYPDVPTESKRCEPLDEDTAARYAALYGLNYNSVWVGEIE